ncbi:hypothetical protein CFP56_032098 [Quercus suber]|uniref:Uncharacterized protein n=1 Tax=Quercus suber TaxID=58331 RepID=A0AAW0JKC4_QUESU
MNFRKAGTLLIIFVICVAILSHGGVEATRVLFEDFGNANSLETGSAVKGACVVQGSVLLRCSVGRAMEGLYIQRGREVGDACTELVTTILEMLLEVDSLEESMEA